MAACRIRTIVTAEFADDIAETRVPTAAPQAASPTEVNTDGQLRATGAGRSRAATRRGTGPADANPAKPVNAANAGTEPPPGSRAALPIARATTVRLPTDRAASSSAHRSVV